ncbi:MAG: hypothetical protein ACJAUO_001158 [Sediminicola sp.]|jgi:hypothetical protein
MGEIFKIETFIQQFSFVGLGFTVLKAKAFQNPIIFTKSVVDVTDEVFTILVQPVVESIATVIRTKFLVYPAYDFLSTFGTFFLHGQYYLLYF